jgi:hypothetical protein
MRKAARPVEAEAVPLVPVEAEALRLMSVAAVGAAVKWEEGAEAAAA